MWETWLHLEFLSASDIYMYIFRGIAWLLCSSNWKELKTTFYIFTLHLWDTTNTIAEETICRYRPYKSVSLYSLKMFKITLFSQTNPGWAAVAIAPRYTHWTVFPLLCLLFRVPSHIVTEVGTVSSFLDWHRTDILFKMVKILPHVLDGSYRRFCLFYASRYFIIIIKKHLACHALS